MLLQENLWWNDELGIKNEELRIKNGLRDSLSCRLVVLLEACQLHLVYFSSV